MQTTTADYKLEINKPSRSFECKITIGNNIYTNEDLVNLTLEYTQPQEGFAIGNTISQSLDLTLLNRGDIIYSTSQIKVEIGLKMGSTIEYILMGIFNIDDIDKTDYTTKFTCYDNVIKFETPYFSSLGDKPTLKQVVNELSNLTGVEFTGSLPDYNVSKLEGFTCREVLSYVASICGGNAFITRDGKFTIKSLSEVEKSIDGNNYFDYTREEVKYKVGQISCQVDENNILSKGSTGTDSMELGFENPWVTETILTEIYNKLNGLSYLGYSMKWQGDISLDPYDIITVTDVKNVIRKMPILSQKITYTGGLTSEIGAKGETKNKNSFSSSGSTTNKVNRAVIEQAIIKEALIEKANIKDVEAANAKIQNLVAEDAKINNALINKAEIKDLNATNANIQKLIAEDAKINNALINKADINQLNAVQGNITSLNSDVANIKTLVNGNLSSENIQAGGITSDKLTIANGFIKNAMIDNLDVSKVNAGDISTNKFRIVSDSGKMLISDNTIQIRDNNRARVQIGKDASSDYNMYIWDKSGKLMFDATGLKADGIKNKIIRDDMISDNANIAGSKINVGSLVTEINKDTNTSLIKASKVAIDLTGQSLEVSFNSLKSNVDNIKIGGRNLLLNGRFDTLKHWYSTDNINIQLYSENNVPKGFKCSNVSNGQHVRSDNNNNLKPNSEYTLSYFQKNITSSRVWIGIYYTNKNGTPSYISLVEYDENIYEDFTKRVVTFKTPEDAYNFQLRIYMYSLVETIFKDFKIENGNKATDWTPAPEDINNAIEDVKQITESNSTTINVMQGQISTAINNTQIVKDGKTVLLKDDYNRTVAKVDSINSTMGSHTTKIDQLTGNITNVDTKVNSVQRDLEGTKSTVSNHTTQINGLNSTVSTQGSSISQLKDKIALKVEASDITNAINNIQIGGRNLLFNSTCINNFEGWSIKSNYFKEYRENNINKGFYVEGGNGVCISSKEIVDMKQLEEYTLTYFQKNTVASKVWIGVYYNNNSYITLVNYDTKVYLDFTKITVTFRTPSGANNFYIRFYEYSTTLTYIKDIQIEKGNKVSDWTPAPEDIDHAISSVDSKVTTTSNKVATIETNLSGITQRVSNTETTTTSLQNTMNNVTSPHGLAYAKDLVIYGESNKYYPVYFKNGNQNVLRTIKIWRSYSEQAPNDWYTSTHKGALMLTWQGNFGGWGGASYKDKIVDYSHNYTTLLADCYITMHSMAYVFFLRGGGSGGAIYHFASDQSFTPEVYYNGSQDLVYNHTNDAYKVYAANPLTAVNAARINGLMTAKESSVTTVKNQVAEIATNLNSINLKVQSTEQTVTNHTTQLGQVDNKINNAINNVQVGGRNLVQKSNDANTYGTENGIAVSKANNFIKVLKNTSSTNSNLGTWKDIVVEPNTEYTVSLQVGHSDSGKIGIGSFISGNNMWSQYGYFNFTANKLFTKTFVTKNQETKIRLFIAISNNMPINSYVEFINLKLEKGNKATDWTPAPEDISSSIANVDTKVNSSMSQIEMLTNKIGLKVDKNNVIASINLYTQENESGTSSGVKISGDKIDLQGQVTFSSLADSNVSGSIKNIFTQQNNQTVINGGMIKTQTIKGNDLLLKGNLTVTDSSSNKTFEITSNGDVNIQAKSLRIGSANVATNNDVNTAINNLQVGGRNYVLKSDAYITGNNNKNFDYGILQELRGKTITVSIEIDLNAAKGSRVGFEPSIVYTDGSEQYIGVWQSISSATTAKKRISATHTIQDKEIKWYNQRGMYIQGVTSGTARIGRPKLEIGTKATDWTSAPEDTVAAINSKVDNTQEAIFNKLFANGQQGFVLEGGKVYINGEVIKANVISGTAIKAGTLDASKIKAGIIQASAGGSYLNLNDGSMMLGTRSLSNYLQWTGSQLNIKANSISIGSSAIATTTDVTNAINNIQIGGRNYIIASKVSCYSSYNTINTSTPGYIKSTWNANWTGNVFTINITGFTPKKAVYTVSGIIKVNGSIPAAKYFTGYASTYGSNLIRNDYDATTGKFIITQSYPGNSSWIFHGQTTRTSGSTDVVELFNLQFEEGNTVTDWNPASEDKVDNNQEAIFNKLFSNGQQGFVLENGKVYINGEVIKANALKGSVISAINMSTEYAKINSANIGNIDASKITTGFISANRLDASTLVSKINGGYTSISGNKIRTGIIRANSGGSYIDLDDGTMQLGTTSKSNYLQWNGSTLKIKGHLDTCTFRGKNMVYIEDNGILSCDGDTYIRHLSVLETHPGWAYGTRGSFDCAPTANFKKEVRTEGEFWARNNSGEFLGVIRRGAYKSGVIQIDRMRVINEKHGSANNYVEVACYNSNHVFGIDLWSSDEKLKENIVSIEDNNASLLNDDTSKTGLNLINNLNHYAYDYKKSFGGDHVTCGYVAQELQELNDSLVMEIEQQDGTTLLQPKASNIIPNLSLAIKQQQKMIEDLKAEIELLKSKLNN